MVQLFVISCSVIKLQAQNLWSTTGFEPAFPDLKTDELPAVLSLGPSANNRRVARNKSSDNGTTYSNVVWSSNVSKHSSSLEVHVNVR